MEGHSAENLHVLESRYRTTIGLVIGQIVCSLILAWVIWFFAPRVETDVSQQTLTTLSVGIIFLAVLGFLVRRMFFRWDRLRDIAVLRGVSGLLKTLQNNALILAAFATLLPILGAVIAVLSGNVFEIVRAEIVAIIVFLINFPRKSVWKKIAAAMEKV